MPDIGALSTVQMPPANECVYASAFGADPNGVLDSSRAIQDAINAANGRKVCVRAGTYKLENRLDFVSGTHLVMHRNAILRRADNFSGTGGPSAFLRSASHSQKVNNVTIEGGQLSATYNGIRSGGRMIDWYGDGWTVRNLIILDWANPNNLSRAISYVGNNATVEHTTIRGPGCGLGCGGIIVGGGNGHVIQFNDILAGDDPIGFFPGAPRATSNPKLINVSIRDAYVFKNRGHSTHARGLAMGLHCMSNFDCNAFTASVTDITVKDYEAYEEHNKPTSMSVLVMNGSSNGEVARITLDDVRADNGDRLAHGIKIIGESGAPLRDVTIRNSMFDGNCSVAGLFIRRSTNVLIENTTIIPNQGCTWAVYAAESQIRVGGGNDFRGPTTGF